MKYDNIPSLKRGDLNQIINLFVLSLRRQSIT